MVVAEAHADGVGAAVGDERIVGFDTVEDRGCILGDLFRREAKARGDDGVDLEVGGRTAERILDAVLNVYDAGDFANGVGDALAEVIKQHRVVGEDLDLNGLGGVREVADHVLKDLGGLDVKLGLGGLDLLADIVHYFVDAAAAFLFELDADVAGVGLGDCGEAELHAGAARRGFDLRRLVEDALDVVENSARLIKRAAGGHDVVEDEAALIHCGQHVGAEEFVAGVGADNESQRGKADPEWLVESPCEKLAMDVEDALEEAAGAEQDYAESGCPSECEQERRDKRDGHRDGERSEEAARYAADDDKR